MTTVQRATAKTATPKGKVLIVIQNLPVPFDNRIWKQGRTLRDNGYQVTFISPTGQHKDFQEKHEVLEGMHVYRYPAPPDAQGTLGYIFEFMYCWLMVALLSVYIAFRHGFQVIHACNPPDTYWLLAALYKPFGKRFIFDHRDVSPEIYAAKGGDLKGFLGRGLLFLERMSFLVADAVIATNESYKQVAMERGKVPEDRVFIVRSGPSVGRLKVLEPEAELKKGKPHMVTYLGEMCKQDGVDLFLYMARHMVEDLNRDDVHFTLVGGGPELQKLKEMKSELGLDDVVTFTERVSDHDLCRYLSTADVCIDPDPYSEWANMSTMNKIMEYMFFGKAIVAFNLKENRFSGQDAALYAEPNDYVQMAELAVELLDNPEKREEMGIYGQNRIHTKLAYQYTEPYLLAAYARALGTAAPASVS